MSADPRLNSVHLESPRRHAYRQAREALLNARGWHTLAAERLPAAAGEEHAFQTPVQHEPPGENAGFWLQACGSIYPLKVGLNTIGRSSDNDVVIEDACVSRRHCAILVHASNVCELHDTASKNGTYLNGQRLNCPTRLVPGDEIRMCDCHLLFLAPTDPSPASDPSATQAD